MELEQNTELNLEIDNKKEDFLNSTYGKQLIME